MLARLVRELPRLVRALAQRMRELARLVRREQRLALASRVAQPGTLAPVRPWVAQAAQRACWMVLRLAQLAPAASVPQTSTCCRSGALRVLQASLLPQLALPELVPVRRPAAPAAECQGRVVFS